MTLSSSPTPEDPPSSSSSASSSSSSSSLTNFSDRPNTTVKTGETDEPDATDATDVKAASDQPVPAIGNAAFLSAVFPDRFDDCRPVIVGFAGNPNAVNAGAWRAHPWDGGAAFEAPPCNAYFSLATFRPGADGQYLRRKAQFKALHAIMLDDIGTKVAPDLLKVSPSWLIETSPGNHQAGYLLESPVEDERLASRLMKTLIAAGLSDPGADGPAARLARLPCGVNGKHAPPFSCRLVTWNPGRRFSIGELARQLQLDIDAAPARQRAAPAARARLHEDDAAVWLPAPAENPVLAALRERGWVKSALGDGRHDISCPWRDEHTGGVDHGTVYFEPSEQWPIGGFKCQHGHCAQRTTRDLLTYLGLTPAQARMRPTIRSVAGELHRIVDAAERELARTGHHYQRGGMIVTLHRDPADGALRIQPVSPPALMKGLAAAASWERFDQRSHDWARIDPPARVTSVLHEQGRYMHLPVLTGIVRQPCLRADGSLIAGPGYDIVTGLYAGFEAADYAIPEAPTREQAAAALAVLDGLLDEFSFADPADRSAALCALLTAAIRGSLAQAPMFHVRAPMAGSGKSYLCELISALSTPERPAPTAFPSDDDECRKLLLAELLRAPAVIEFDNLTGDLVPHKSLCTAITAGQLSGRILGVSRTASVSTRVLLLSSGNNVGPVGDMTRRCVTIHLSPQVEQPAARSFARPLLAEEVRRERGRYVSAAITVVRAAIVAGRQADPFPALASFDQWSGWCRWPLVWLGHPDPAGSTFAALTQDPGREELARLMRAWFDVFGSRATRVKTVAEKIGWQTELTAELREAVLDVAGERGEVNRKRLGWYLKRQEGRIVEGMRFVRAGLAGSAEHWRLEKLVGEER